MTEPRSVTPLLASLKRWAHAYGRPPQSRTKLWLRKWLRRWDAWKFWRTSGGERVPIRERWALVKWSDEASKAAADRKLDEPV